MHLPQIDLLGEGLSSVRTFGVVDAARDVVDRSGDMDLTTTLSLPSLRGPVPVAKTLAAPDVLSGAGASQITKAVGVSRATSEPAQPGRRRVRPESGRHRFVPGPAR